MVSFQRGSKNTNYFTILKETMTQVYLCGEIHKMKSTFSRNLHRIIQDSSVCPQENERLCSTLKTFLHCNRKHFNLNCDTKMAQFVKNQAKYIEFEINIGNLSSQILAICGWSVLKNGFHSTNQVTHKHSY